MQTRRLVTMAIVLTVSCNRLSRAYPLVAAYPQPLTAPLQAAPFQATSYLSQHAGNARLSVVEWDHYNERNVQGHDTYAFGYDVQNPETDDIHFRHEERLPNGTVVGSYGYVTPDGDAHVVKYIADQFGYRAAVETTKRLADVKPIPVNVDQALADELAAAELALQNENPRRVPVPVAAFDQQRQKYITTRTIQPQEAFSSRLFVDNRKGLVYSQSIQNNLAQAIYATNNI